MNKMVPMAPMDKIIQNIYDDLTSDDELKLPEVKYLTVRFEPQVITFAGCTAYTVRFMCHKKRVSSVYWIEDSTGDVASTSHIWMIGRRFEDD